MGLTPAFSSPAVCSGIFHSCIFHPWNYARAAFSTPVFSVAPTEIWAVWRPQVERKKVWRFLTQQFNCCTCAVCRCTVLLEQSRYQARCIKLRSRKSAAAHPRARIHSRATLRPRERPRGSAPVGAARVVRLGLIEFRVNL